MRTVSCCFTVFHVNANPTTPWIYSIIVFNFWTFFSHSVADTENQPVLGLGF